MRADQSEVAGIPQDPVGRRVSCGGERATVRYVGHVSPYEGKMHSTVILSSFVLLANSDLHLIFR